MLLTEEHIHQLAVHIHVIAQGSSQDGLWSVRDEVSNLRARLQEAPFYGVCSVSGFSKQAITIVLSLKTFQAVPDLYDGLAKNLETLCRLHPFGSLVVEQKNSEISILYHFFKTSE